MKNKVYVYTVVVDGLETKIALKDEELGHRFGFWLVGNDYEFTLKLYPEGYALPDNNDRAVWLFNEFMREDSFHR